jgi:protein involved in polysaccharide export with SLBB domain
MQKSKRKAQVMLCNKSLPIGFIFISFGSSLLFSGAVRGQENPKQRPPLEDTLSRRPAEPSDLAKENLDRVAASAAQIREVLAKDAGILVELKRLVAKEATDDGQIVEDSSLTDDAVFDRLEHDVVFRSLATRLAQRYGYLLPSVNPDSPAAKQEDLVLKERARRLVQIEAQEDAESLHPQPKEQNQEQSIQRAACGTRNQDQANCNPLPPGAKGRSLRDLRDATRPEDFTNPLPVLPVVPQLDVPSLNSDAARILRARAGRDSTDLGGSSSLTDSGLSSASDALRRNPNALLGSLPTGSSLDGLGSLLRPGNLDGLSALGVGSRMDTVLPMEPEKNRIVRLPGERGSLNEAEMEKDLPSVSMVHKRNPYADIPSLYDLYVQAAPRDHAPERFGLEIFQNGTRDLDSFPIDLPVGPDYLVGPGDGLAINLWGSVSQRITRIVDRQGRIALPEAGPLLVSGRTLGEVQQSVQEALRSQFREVSADVSLSRLKTVRVYVVGEVDEPGAYDISSLSTPLNALFAAGGVTERGSLRAIRHYRGKQLIEEVDAYDLLLRGVGSELKQLENGDSLIVPPIGEQATVTGMVRRPAVYELHGEKSLADVLDLAGGILPAAALKHIEVQRLEAHEKRTMLSLDLSSGDDPSAVSKQLSDFKIQDGDQIHIFPIAPHNESAIYLQGHVLRPGRYSYHEGMKISDVISSYADLLPEPSGRYAEIIRLNAPDFRPSVESFDLSSALTNPAAAPKLQPLDTIRIFSRYDFEPAPSVWVGGEVRAPGKYRTSGQAHVRDAVYLAGGISPDASLDSAQLFRTEHDGTMKILSLNLGEALAGNPADNMALEPRDRILIHRNSSKVDPATVYIKGEVAKPGRYPLTSNMHIEDLIRVAGGLKRSADTASADLTRYAEGAETQHVPAENMDIKLSAAMTGDDKADIPLRDGDVLTIRQNPGWGDIGALVTLKGEVQHPGSYGIRPGEQLSSVLERAGGFGPQAYPYGAVLMRREVREVEMKNHLELVQRLKVEQISLKALPDGDQDQKTAKTNAIAETESALTQLQETSPVGRVVIHIKPNVNEWRNTAADVPVRDGDVLVIPKIADYVMVSGQVFNPTAVSYRPGRSAKWYLSQSGGTTPLADKKGVFVIRADGSVIAAKNSGDGWFSGDPLNTTLKPGDSIIVPEKAPKIGGRNWATTLQAAQVASSVALAVAYIHP